MPTQTLEEITQQIEALNNRATELLASAESDSTKTAEVKALVDDEIKPQLATLTAAHEKAVKEEEYKALTGTVSTLQKEIEDLRKPSGAFKIASPEGKADDDSNPYADPASKFSMWQDIRMANKGSQVARERLIAGAKAFTDDEHPNVDPEGKAWVEETGSQGGYLVQPLLERQLILAREKDNILRGLCSTLNVTTNSVQLDQLGLTTSAGWVEELKTKPESGSMTTASVTASIFTAAGLATISNQLLADSNPAIDQLLTTDLAKRIVALEESSFLFGTGTQQPRGILETAGVEAISFANAEDPAAEGSILDQILTAIAQVQQAWGQPSAIVMHPRTWTAILKSRDSVGHYTIAPRQIFTAGYDPETPRTYIEGPAQSLFGIEVALSNRVPTNLGTGTNESRVIVGDFKEALILDRQGITIDESPHVYFTTNQTVFRAEARVGFTAARSPKAFSVIGGPGLANR